jgi:hypothetical protein
MKLLKVLSVFLLLFTNCAMGQTDLPIKKNNAVAIDSVLYQVDVTFFIDESGLAKVVHVDSENPELVQYVLQKFEKIQVNSENYFVGKTMRYRFRFKMDPRDLLSSNSKNHHTSLIATFAADAKEEGYPHSES